MAWNKSGGWIILSSFAKARSRKPSRDEIANDKLLLPWATRGYMGGVTQMISVCGLCKHFEVCQVLKGVQADTKYCQYRVGRFEGVNEI